MDIQGPCDQEIDLGMSKNHGISHSWEISREATFNTLNPSSKQRFQADDAGHVFIHVPTLSNVVKKGCETNGSWSNKS